MNEASDCFNIHILIHLYSSLFTLIPIFILLYMVEHYMLVSNSGFMKSLLQFLSIAKGLLQGDHIIYCPNWDPFERGSAYNNIPKQQSYTYRFCLKQARVCGQLDWLL